VVFVTPVVRHSGMAGHFQKGVTQRALCVDHVMLVENDVKILDHIQMLCIVARNCRAINQIPSRHEHTVDVQ